MKDSLYSAEKFEGDRKHSVCQQRCDVIRSVIYQCPFWKQGEAGLAMGIGENDGLGESEAKRVWPKVKVVDIKKEENTLKRHLGVELKGLADGSAF